MTILLGPTPCKSCGTPVTVVRRPARIHGHGEACPKKVPHPYCSWAESKVLLETVMLDGDAQHACITVIATEQTFGQNTGAGASGQSNILNVAPASQLAPGPRAPFHVGSKTT